jgi:putative nucleotidyltransferase with HDIG domain
VITAAEIETIFAAQLRRIEDSELRRRTVEVWVEGAKRGGWTTVAELTVIPFTLLTDTHGIGLVEHTIAVTEGAVGLAEAQMKSYPKMPYVISMDRLLAGGLLHDVGKLLEVEPDGKGGYRKSQAGRYARHPISGAILAARCGMPDDIVNIIACHAREGDGAPKVIETVLIHQSDFAAYDPLVMLEKKQLIR